MTSVEPRIRIPAWRSASPKNLNTRSVHTSRTTVPVNRPISPAGGEPFARQGKQFVHAVTTTNLMRRRRFSNPRF